MDALSRLEAAGSRSEARSIAEGQTGLSEAFFDRVAELAGQNPAACARLADLADMILTDSPRDQAYLLRAQAVGARARGRWLEAADLFVQAGNLLRGNELWVFSIGAIDSYARGGSPRLGVEYGRKALKKVRDQSLTARIRLNLGNALTWQDQNEAAAREYSLALKDLGSQEFQMMGIAHLGISTANLISGDPEVARTHAEKARENFANAKSFYHADLASLNLAQHALVSGRADEAVARLLELRPRFLASPQDLARILEFLGDAYLRLNFREEARQSYREALGLRIMREMPLNRSNCRYGLATTEAGKESARLFRLAAKGYRAVQNRPWELVSAGRGALATGDFSTARSAYKSLQATKSQFLAEEFGLLAAEQDLIPMPESPRSPLLEWRHAWLAARREPTLGAYSRVFELIERDRLAISTPSAALRFLDDRGKAVSEYLDLLIDSGHVEGAVDVIGRTRSAALADEIAAAHGEKLGPDVLAELDRFRAEFARDSSPGARWRRTVGPVVARTWLEKTWGLRRGAAPTLGKSGKHDVWLDNDGRLFRIRGTHLFRPEITAAMLQKSLDWLEFFLFEPMINRNACPHSCVPLLANLREMLGDFPSAVCPDGVLWRIPWPLLSEDEVVLQLGPGFSQPHIFLKPQPRLAIWVARAEDLPSLDAEVEAVCAAFPQATVLETRQQVRSTYGQDFDLIHVAGHARINSDSPSFSYVDFVDGPLFAAEIARSGVRCEVAVVAACQSGVSIGHQRFEPEGLVRAFLACGASAAVGSLWPLDDEFTYHFMNELYPMLKEGHSLVDSMRESRIRSRDRFAHPYFWGALATFGGYR